ncbi:MAG: hypothetical protein LBL75_03285 [Rickettsiales bacterium]|jgi:hypothetical protein|nr:hypothetical protein [Rickettsiales bacterium]
MRLKFSVFAIFLCANSAFAALPSVDFSRAVSARDMYGAAPSSQQIVKKSEPVRNFASGDVLTPRRPAFDLWASSDTPLRMPRADEIVKLSDDFMLPDESLEASRVVARIPVKKVKSVPVKKENNTDEILSAYNAGRIAELQRIADNASQRTESKTRKLVVPMDDTGAAVATIRSTKQTPMTEDEFAYKNSDDIPLTKLSPSQLKRAFKKTYVSENKHLSAYRSDDDFDSFGTTLSGVTSVADLSEGSEIRPLEIKLSFMGDDSSLSRDNYKLLSEYAGIVVSNPTRAVQVSIPSSAAQTYDGRKLAARRLAIVEQVLTDNGIASKRIVPVLTDRDDDSLVLRVISNEVYKTLTQNRGKKTIATKSLSW